MNFRRLILTGDDDRLALRGEKIFHQRGVELAVRERTAGRTAAERSRQCPYKARYFRWLNGLPVIGFTAG